MNIKITYQWLLDYLDTDADPYELQKYLSLCGPSVETVEAVGDDYVLDIEITSNRVDMASVFGIAQEAQAILPRFGKRAKLRSNPLHEHTFDSLRAEPVPSRTLKVTIEDPSLCPRFTALAFGGIEMKEAPEYIRTRLERCDIRSINAVVDISNYVMLSLGQPTHMFDLKKISGHVMHLRTSKKGETVTTLDGKNIILPGGDIVIEDGSGKIIDLCGIMGGANSEISSDTAEILFFVQTYDKRKIRKTSMTTGQRSVAATYFEKGLDPGRVETAFAYGTRLISDILGGVASSELIDIYPHPRRPATVKVWLKDIERLIGVTIGEETIETILTSLGFELKRHENDELAYPDGVSFHITVPTHRIEDIAIPEDIIEEVARVYGYHNLPNVMSPLVYIKQPPEIEHMFKIISRTKHFLKALGLHEFLNYSMVSNDALEGIGMDPKQHLRIANTISAEIEYMRRSLTPSLVKNIRENIGKKVPLRIFEVGKIYTPQSNELPDEQYVLGIATTTDFFDLKGILEALFHELHISGVRYVPETSELLAGTSACSLSYKNRTVGRAGMLKTKYTQSLNISSHVAIAEIDIRFLGEFAYAVAPFTEPVTTAAIKLDTTLQIGRVSYEELERTAKSVSPHLIRVELIDTYGSNKTIRWTFADRTRNFTEDEAKKELNTIIKELDVS